MNGVSKILASEGSTACSKPSFLCSVLAWNLTHPVLRMEARMDDAIHILQEQQGHVVRTRRRL